MPVAGVVLVEGAVGAVVVAWVWVTTEVEVKVVVAMRGRDVILDTFGVASGVSCIAKRRSLSSGSAGFSESEPEVVGSGVDVMLLRAEYGQTLAKGIRLLGKSTGSYGKPETTRVH